MSSTINLYNLIYTHNYSPQHIIELVKGEMNANIISRTDNVRLAEWCLKQLEWQQESQEKVRLFHLQNGDREGALASEKALSYISHLHEAKEHELKSRFQQPELSDDEAGELLFKMSLENELEKLIPKEIDCEIEI